MSTQRRDQEYFHPRNPNGYWRTAIQREMQKMEQLYPGIFSQPQPQQGVSQ